MNMLILQISFYNCLCKLSFIYPIFKCVLKPNLKVVKIPIFHKLKVIFA